MHRDRKVDSWLPGAGRGKKECRGKQGRELSHGVGFLSGVIEMLLNSIVVMTVQHHEYTRKHQIVHTYLLIYFLVSLMPSVGLELVTLISRELHTPLAEPTKCPELCALKW